jgi:hypothetical protein
VRVRTSCGCAKAAVSDDEIAPGKEATLTVSIGANSLQGPYTKHVFVHWRQSGPEGGGTGQDAKPASGLLRLTVRGVAKPLLEVRPGRAVALGRVTVGVRLERALALEAGLFPVVFGKPKLPEGMEAEMAGGKLEPGGKMALRLVFTPRRIGAFREVVEIPVLEPKGHPPVGILVHGTAVERAEQSGR